MSSHVTPRLSKHRYMAKSSRSKLLSRFPLSHFTKTKLSGSHPQENEQLMKLATERKIQLLVDGGTAILGFDEQGGGSVYVVLPERQSIAITPYEVLGAEVNAGVLRLSFMNRTSCNTMVLVEVDGHVRENELNKAIHFCEELMTAAYSGVKRNRRLRVLVNPHGGKGKACLVYRNEVEPVLKAAKCTYDTTITTHSKHAQEICREIPLDTYDAVLTLSGDGLIHEVINGFAEHKESNKAFAIPIGPIPTGSGNGTSINLLGLEDGFVVGAAALNAIKGKIMKSDLVSATINGKTVYSFMTQALGLMSDLDLNTEYLRWMGDKRFIVGYLQGVMMLRVCPVKLSMKIAEADKHKMAEEFRSQESKKMDNNDSDSSGEEALETNSLLHTKRYSEGEDGWVTFDRPIIYIYAGKGPYVGRDLMQFPVSKPSDGLIDIVAQELTTRGELFRALDGSEKGDPYWLKSQHYFKVHGYRITPLKEGTMIAIDGERYPLSTFEVEVHQGLASFLSPTGRYASDYQFGAGRQQQPATSRSSADVMCCYRSP